MEIAERSESRKVTGASAVTDKSSAKSQDAGNKVKSTTAVTETSPATTQDAGNTFSFGNSRPPFTPEEHQIFLVAYDNHPKQFGKIAGYLEGRDLHDCVAHYYEAKHNEDMEAISKKKA